jgi:hypothetical protein
VSANRNLHDLAPLFRAPFEAWLNAAQDAAKHVRLFHTETRRTLVRQQGLYAIGRTAPGRIVTNTLNSFHRWGLAADLAMQRPTGELVWSEDSWRWVYRQVPPEHYGLRTLDPFELVHLELWWAADAVREADRLGLTQT